MKNILDIIDIGNKSTLKGDLTKIYSAVVLLSSVADIKTEELPKGTALPALMRYRIKPDEKLVNFIATLTSKAQVENKRVLIISDDGMANPTGVTLQLLMRYGFTKPDTGGHSFPLIAMRVCGTTNALIPTKTVEKQFGITDDELKLIPDNSKNEQAQTLLDKPKPII